MTVTHHSMIIGGEEVDTSEQLEIVDPSTGEVVATVARGDESHIDLAVESGRKAFDAGDWSRAAPAERAAVLRNLANLLGDNIEEMVEAEIQANGATVRQATGFHVGLAAPHLEYFAQLADSYEWETPTRIAAFPTIGQSTVRREPIGVVGAVAPWNFPLLLGLWKMAPALAAGNSVVIKPDERTPLSTLLFARLALEAGVPAGVLNVVPGIGHVAGARLAAHPGVGKIGFTGSTQVGREIMRTSADTLKGVTLELGGKSPAIVLDDADLDTTVDGLLWGCMLYSGQICMSMTRALVPEHRKDEFVDRLVERASTIQLGGTRDWETDMGPIVSARQHQRVLGYIESGKAEGATLALGGGVPEVEGFEGGYYVEPTIFSDVTPDMTIAREEIFGPVLSVLTYRTEAEAVEIANDSEYGLASSIWTADNSRALQMAGQVQAGTVWINDAHKINVEVPFGGYKQSGVGRELGPHALDHYTEVKDVYLDLSNDKAARPWDVLLSHADD
ncbi:MULTISPECIES: aldehyde dehydrogenase family protein [unclassified Nocardioides]|uniref:aldehyde dehydrogenase family protein n=1 Tax=unclassified Nocardioides TaxID=2615069 RepID=UPI0007039188|nr:MULTISPECIES: aldehyde dehydrogenase family protein [unclassified Nocardioides]KRC54159.1 aldehyde dehydrogenase [Nocardioides sp. Root79]KRC71495.1 aldehyde dehydrogenase [Nocardioides sp. Root240]